MNDKRTCTDCGAPLTTGDPHPVCPACIFRRLSNTGSTIHPPDVGAGHLTGRGSKNSERQTDFESEYELLGEIGRGGMGVIYKAHQAGLNRIVALKLIHAASAAGEAARRRFQSEVEVAARLNHPNIVPIFDTGEMDGCPCFSMEFLPGGSLAERMNQFAANPASGARLLVKVARAVFFAHQHGVLHRDLKPANILLDADGEPHVADFGLAKQLNSDSDITRSGAVIGSPNYMSPEQAAGKSNSLTVATDIYSLGVILYQMLTGRTPFMAGTALETMRLVVENEPKRPSTIVVRADRDLETICLKCLEKEPARRYHTAEEFADDLERWLRHEPIHARKVTGWERSRKWVRRHPALTAVSAMFLVALFAGMSGVIWQWQKAEQARSSETRQRHRAESALARSAISLAESALREGNGQAMKAALETVPVALRDATWTYLLAESDTSRPLPPIGLTQLDDLVPHPARPSVFAAADHAGKVVLFNVRDGSRLLEFAPGFATVAPDAELRIAFSKAGDRIAIGRNGPGGIVIHNGGDGRKLAEWDAPRSGRLEFSPDGTMLLQTSADRKRTDVWGAADGARRWRHKGRYHAARFTADGQQVASYSWEGQLRLVKSADGAEVRKLSDNYFEEFAAQPGGTLLVAGNPLGFVRGFELKEGRQRFEFQPHESIIRHVAFLPGGERFLTAATLTDSRLALQCWDAVSPRAPQALLGGSGDIRIICLHPLSGELIVSGREARVWETAGVPPVRVIHGHNPHPSAVFWGAGDLLFAPGPDGDSADLQSISGSGSPSVLWTAETGDHGQPSVSADGRRAAIGRYHSNHHIAVLQRVGSAITQVASLTPARPLDYVRLSPAGDRVAAAEEDFTQIQLFDVATAAQPVALDVRDIQRFSDFAWLDDGKHLAGLVTTQSPRNTPGSVEQVILWDTATGQRLRAATNNSLTSVACAAPDGRRFAEAGADRNVRLRDAATLEVLREFRVHNAPVTALAWHPTRPILATASEDLAIRLWNLDDGTRLEELRGPLSPPNVLSFSPDGNRLATAARDGAARVWEPRCLRR